MVTLWETKIPQWEASVVPLETYGDVGLYFFFKSCFRKKYKKKKIIIQKSFLRNVCHVGELKNKSKNKGLKKLIKKREKKYKKTTTEIAMLSINTHMNNN